MTDLQVSAALLGALADEQRQQHEVYLAGQASDVNLIVAWELSQAIGRVMEQFSARLVRAGAAGLISGGPYGLIRELLNAATEPEATDNDSAS